MLTVDVSGCKISFYTSNQTDILGHKEAIYAIKVTGSAQYYSVKMISVVCGLKLPPPPPN